MAETTHGRNDGCAAWICVSGSHAAATDCRIQGSKKKQRDAAIQNRVTIAKRGESRPQTLRRLTKDLKRALKLAIGCLHDTFTLGPSLNNDGHWPRVAKLRPRFISMIVADGVKYYDL